MSWLKSLFGSSKLEIPDRLLGDAIESGSLATVQSLLKSGANPYRTGRSREYAGRYCDLRPLQLAVYMKQPAIVRFLLKTVYKVGAQPDSSDTRSLQEHLHVYDQFGLSLLHRAARDGNPEMVRLLLDAGANPNLKTESHRVAHLDPNDDQTVQSETRPGGKTALDLAAAGETSGHVEVVGLLRGVTR